MSIIYFVLQSFLIGLIGTWLFEQVLKINKKLRNRYYNRHKIILGYHTHHSMYGLLSILIAMILYWVDRPNTALFFAALGVGIIIMHTISSGRLVFIEKQ